MSHRGPPLIALLVTLACAPGTTPSGTGPSPDLVAPHLARITDADLTRDLEALAGDAMRGREAGTLDELRASAWLAEQARAIGMEPAGDDGTYFQFWPMRRTRISDGSWVGIGGKGAQLWRDVVIASSSDASVELPIVFIGEGSDADLSRVDLRGKAAAALVVRPSDAAGANVSLSAWRYARSAVRAQSQALFARGAAAVILVADSVAEAGMSFYAAATARGTYAIDTGRVADRGPAQPPVFLVKRSLLDQVRAPNARLGAMVTVESFMFPSVNVVARVRGTDAQLRDEYVLVSAHQDHDGVRYPAVGDSIWNGADDNGTASVALLAIGRAWVAQPGRRSALFVWHGAEERGLLGSRWHALRPTVPRSSLVAVLNADMIGRNHPDTASLLGGQPPHRNSTALVEMAFEANRRTARFVLDSTWDRPTHPEGFYFRSDHLPYVRVGIPAVFYTTKLHPDYHTPRDEPKTIDIPKLRRVTQWMYATSWLVANARERPAIDPGFKLERD
jgi:hypothetical protein